MLVTDLIVYKIMTVYPRHSGIQYQASTQGYGQRDLYTLIDRISLTAFIGQLTQFKSAVFPTSWWFCCDALLRAS